MNNTCIVASGVKQDIGCRVILWDEVGGYSFYPSKKYLSRKDNIEELRKKIKLFCLHHSVTFNSKQTYLGLIGRELSVNFIINDDIDADGYATIYQCLDIKDAGYSQGPYNSAGPGVEISYHPEAWKNKDLYNERNQKTYGVQPHEIVKDKIHNVELPVFKPTEAQIKSCIALLTGFCKLFPNIQPEFPKDVNGNIIKTVVKDPKGLVNHYNLTLNKVDTMGLPLSKIELEIKNNLKPINIEKTEVIEPFQHEVKSSVLSRIRCGVANWFKR